jgi:hypothetical protein
MMPMTSEEWAKVTTNTWLKLKNRETEVCFVSDHPIETKQFIYMTRQGGIASDYRDNVECRTIRHFKVEVLMSEDQLTYWAHLPESSASANNPHGAVMLRLAQQARLVNEKREESDRRVR